MWFSSHEGSYGLPEGAGNMESSFSGQFQPKSTISMSMILTFVTFQVYILIPNGKVQMPL